MKKPTVDVSNAGVVARTDYVAILEQIVAEGHCPFCREHLFKHHTKPVLIEGKHWLVTENFKPYTGTRYHFLVICKSHVTRISNLPTGAGDEIIELHRWLENRYNLDGSTLLCREGDTTLTGASVAHLHYQVVVGVSRSEKTDPLTALIGFKQK